jgi:uncharacterized protein (UPF0332 family)
MNWRTYLALAEVLSNTNEPAYLRSAISRAYYCIFNIARIKAGYNVRGEVESHIKFINSLKEADDEIVVQLDIDENDVRFLGNQLDGLRKERNEADYNGLATTITQKRAKEVNKQVVEMLEILSSPTS